VSVKKLDSSVQFFDTLPPLLRKVCTFAKYITKKNNYMAVSSSVNISFKKDLLDQIDQMAKVESCSRSELISEAARVYIARKLKWKSIFSFGEKIASMNGLSEEDVMAEIKSFRKEK
jgi:predicted transcriptional regulator